MVNTASTMRVLNVLRHWLTKHPLVRINVPFIVVVLSFEWFSLKIQNADHQIQISYSCFHTQSIFSSFLSRIFI
jgi:hypothetical protein